MKKPHTEPAAIALVLFIGQLRRFVYGPHRSFDRMPCRKHRVGSSVSPSAFFGYVSRVRRAAAANGSGSRTVGED
jgi:hypothetical protein